MNTINILLIIICGAGLIHGLTLAVYFGFIKTKRTNSAIFLAILLFLMALRVGKSIIFQFNTNLEFLFIFLGVSILLIIGPLLSWYVKSLIVSNFKLPKLYYLQIIPFVFILGVSPFVSEQWFITNGKHWSYILLVGIYVHFAFYIFISFRLVYNFNKSFLNTQKTKSQERILKWLQLIIIGFSLIWFSYVLNIFEKQVPYIIGPIIYTICIYALTYVAYRLKINELNAKSFEPLDDSSHIYLQVVDLIKNSELYLSSDISLQKLSELTGFSSHKISSSINEYSKMNFNNFINQYRIKKAKNMLQNEGFNKFTIASIAYDAGFSSLSSFNTSFKKFEKITPSTYRNSLKTG
ncbi:helix-turn-helix domain-containing protein [Kordia sp.]|uniref:helix-turn-helix domain-containing protein n=1 Tax=Kordia sp. TaxID=1965332 RepID=UPI003D29740B